MPISLNCAVPSLSLEAHPYGGLKQWGIAHTSGILDLYLSLEAHPYGGLKHNFWDDKIPSYNLSLEAHPYGGLKLSTCLAEFAAFVASALRLTPTGD